MTNPSDARGWIWGEWEERPDLKVCFRGLVPLETGESVTGLDIWADSRYYLWINGEYVGTGPQRCWPNHPYSDRYSLQHIDGGRGLLLAVLVWHYGTSTARYIHGGGGLYVSGEISQRDGRSRPFAADAAWVAAEHTGCVYPVPRINVSQPWIEMADAARFPSNWLAPDFDDGTWRNAVPLHPPPERGRLTVRETPMPVARQLSPVKILEERKIRCTGMGLRIDYKAAFYPSDTSTEDRFQTGYIATVLRCASAQTAGITLADRLWPEITERILVNGAAYPLNPGIRRIDVPFREGVNLLMLDVSGARQRFTSDLHIDTAHPIEFLSPFEDDSTPFHAVGPFDVQDIGNIACLDGFEEARPGELYRRAGLVRDTGDLEAYRHLMTPLTNVLIDGVKLRSTGAAVAAADFGNEYPSKLRFPGNRQSEDEEIILDMGGEVSGFLGFRVEAGEGGEFDFRFAENMHGGQLEIPHDLDTSLRFICGRGSTEFRSLLRRGFRYLAVRYRGIGPALIENIGVDERLYPSPQRGDFRSSDAELDRIWRMCRRTVELCSEDTFVDCPAFEQAFWIGDAYVMSLYRQYLFGDTSLTRHCLVLAALSMERSPLPDCHLPAGVSLVLTAWSQLWIIACRDYWMFTGDSDFAAEIHPWITRCLDEFRRHFSDEGLLSISAWNLLDWAPVDTPYHGVNAHLNARQVECFRAAGDLAEVVGRDDEAITLRKEATRLAGKSHEAFWAPGRKAYRDCIHVDGHPSDVFSVQTNLLMIHYGCVPKPFEQDVHSFITHPPKDAVLPGSPFFAHFFYDYLFSRDSGAAAVDGILNRWRPMLDHGTCWETFEGFYEDRPTRSYCHGWSAAPSCLLGKWILGIRPLAPGFRKIKIAPRTGGLSRARGIVPIPQGDVEVDWVADHRSFRCAVTVPMGVEWDIEEPSGPWKNIRIDVAVRAAEIPEP